MYISTVQDSCYSSPWSCCLAADKSCPPCRPPSPSLEQLSEQLDGQDLFSNVPDGQQEGSTYAGVMNEYYARQGAAAADAASTPPARDPSGITAVQLSPSKPSTSSWSPSHKRPSSRRLSFEYSQAPAAIVQLASSMAAAAAMPPPMAGLPEGALATAGSFPGGAAFSPAISSRSSSFRGGERLHTTTSCPAAAFCGVWTALYVLHLRLPAHRAAYGALDEVLHRCVLAMQSLLLLLLTLHLVHLTAARGSRRSTTEDMSGGAAAGGAAQLWVKANGQVSRQWGAYSSRAAVEDLQQDRAAALIAARLVLRSCTLCTGPGQQAGLA